MILGLSTGWKSERKTHEEAQDWQSHLMKAIDSVEDELNGLSNIIQNTAFKQTVFEYNERFFAGVLSNGIIRSNSIEQSNTIQEFSVYHDTKSVGRADLLGIFNNEINSDFVLFELKKWSSYFTKEKLEDETSDIWDDYFMKSSSWQELKDQVRRYANMDTFILDNSFYKVTIAFEHITNVQDPRSYEPFENQLRNSIAEKYSQLLSHSLDQDHISFYKVLQNEFENEHGMILDHLAIYGKILE